MFLSMREERLLGLLAPWKSYYLVAKGMVYFSCYDLTASAGIASVIPVELEGLLKLYS